MRPIDADALPYKTHKWRNPDGQEHEWNVVDKYDIDNAPTIEPCKSTDQNVENVPSGYMCFSCKYGSRIGMPCKECKHDYEDKYTPINKYAAIPRWNADLISRESAICAIENTNCELTTGDWDELTDAINKIPSFDVVSREEYNKLLANSIWESEHITDRPKVNSAEPSDIISRAEVHHILSLLSTEGGKDAKLLFSDAHESIDALPSADRPKGEWIRVTNGRGGHECSNCHAYAPSYMSGDEYLSDFCPNCGADMRGEK